MGIVSKGEQLIKIPLYYKEKDMGGVLKPIVLDDLKAKKMLADPEQAPKVNLINTYWKIVSWQDNNSIHKASERKEEKAVPGSLDWIRWRDLRLKTFLKKWDAKDEEGKDIPLDNETINSLDNDIAEALLDKYERVTEITEEEIKN